MDVIRLSARNVPLFFALLLALGLLVVAAVEEAQPFEIYRSAGKTIDGKPLFSSFPYTYDMAEKEDIGRAIGHIPSLGTALELISNGGNTFIISGATSVNISSSATADSGGTAYITGLDPNGDLFTATPTLNGRNPVTVTGVSPYRVFTVQNWTDTAWVGDIYISGNEATYTDGVPDKLTIMKADIGFGGSQQAAFTVPTGKHGHLTNWWGSTSANKLTELVLQVRPHGLTWRTVLIHHINQDHFHQNTPYPLEMSALTDIRIMGSVGVAGGDVSAGFGSWYED
jgi:hypothetical protein